jgi:hypothetical protein
MSDVCIAAIEYSQRSEHGQAMCCVVDQVMGIAGLARLLFKSLA